MIKIGNLPVSDIKLGNTDILGVQKDGHVLWEKDRTEILVTFSGDATAADCYYKINSETIPASELFDEASKTALFRFPSDQNLRFAFNLNKKIEKIHIKKVGSLVQDMSFISAANSVKIFEFSNCVSTSLKSIGGLCFNCGSLDRISIENCHFPNAGIAALFQISTNISEVNIKDVTYKGDLTALLQANSNLRNLKSFTLENINQHLSGNSGILDFQNCESLEILDLSKIGSKENSFTFRKTVFKGCASLKKILLGNQDSWFPEDKRNGKNEIVGIEDIDLSDTALEYSELYSLLYKLRNNPNLITNFKVYVPSSISDNQVKNLKDACKNVQVTIVSGPPVS